MPLKNASPFTSSKYCGVAVPIPTRTPVELYNTLPVRVHPLSVAMLLKLPLPVNTWLVSLGKGVMFSTPPLLAHTNPFPMFWKALICRFPLGLMRMASNPLVLKMSGSLLVVPMNCPLEAALPFRFQYRLAWAERVVTIITASRVIRLLRGHGFIKCFIFQRFLNYTLM